MRQAIGVAAAVVMLWLYGAIHVVYGDPVGIGTCWKHGWSLGDTFVEANRFFDDMPPKVAEALDKCSLPSDPGAWDRDKTIMVITAAVVLMAGLTWLGRRVIPPKKD